MSDTTIACTLRAASYKERVAEIRTLFSRALKASRRDGRSLHLTLDLAARAAVEDLVRKEQLCCAFLDFRLSENDGALTLTITAPAEAADSLDEIFASTG